MEKIYKCLTEESKDVRKGEWNNKEVSCHFIYFRVMKKSVLLDNPARRGGSNAP